VGQYSKSKSVAWLGTMCLVVLTSRAVCDAQPLPIRGTTGAHDPSAVQQYGNDYIYFCTGEGILARTSDNLEDWSNAPAVFATPPAWTETDVPGFTGTFWAPDVSFFDGLYHMYYAVSTFGSQISAIGLATNTTLDPSSPSYDWVDQGPIIQSTTGSAYNTIDPSVLVQSNGSVYMSFGSYWNGIYEVQLNPSTGKLANSTVTHLAYNSQIEASYLYQHGGYYYLFVNFGMCCMGVDSTYNIRVGRSTSVNGPFLDESGKSMLQSGGTLLLGSDGRYIGPGQTGIYTTSTGQDLLSYHYYDGDNAGTPTFALEDLYWTSAGWPTLTNVAVQGSVWSVPGNGSWATGANWSTLAVPAQAQGTVTFGTSTTPDTVTLDGGWTVGTVNFASGYTYTLAPGTGGSLTLNNGTSPAAINVSSGSHSITAPLTLTSSVAISLSSQSNALTISGAISGGGGLTQTGAGTLALSGVNTYAGPTSINSGLLVIDNSASIPQASPLTIGAAATTAAARLATTIGTVAVPSLTVYSGSTLDIANNSLAIEYGSATDSASLVRGYLVSGYNSVGGGAGNWKGTGITSSAAAANPSAFSVGYADGGNPSDHANTGVPAGEIEVMYTVAGDANLSGGVDLSDLVIIASDFGTTGADWAEGDVNYDGNVDLSDLVIVASNFGVSLSSVQTSNFSGSFAAEWQLALAEVHGADVGVPEPASAGALALAGLGVLGRRPRRRGGVDVPRALAELAGRRC
jgi:autotransporter-associated beta strand protein